MKRKIIAINILVAMLLVAMSPLFAIAQKKPSPNFPDLIIDGLSLNAKCQVVVRVKNLGPGGLSDAVWTERRPDSAGVYIYKDGRGWGGESIWLFDPGKALQRPGGTATSTSNLIVTGSATIKAVVDLHNVIREANETNNERTEKLSCPTAPANKPDLTIKLSGPPTARAGERISLPIVVTNIGTADAPGGYKTSITVTPSITGDIHEPAIGPHIGSGGISISLMGGVTIPNPGIYEICATVDSTNIVSEMREDNNRSCIKITITQ